MRAVITVAGKDRVGIIASVTQALAQQNVNVLDITQTILPPDFFTMVTVSYTHLDVYKRQFPTSPAPPPRSFSPSSRPPWLLSWPPRSSAA